MTNLIRLKQIETGSLTEPNWNSIIGIPVGIVSQSTDITPLNQFTSSYYTDSSSFDSKILTESGRIDAILSASNADADTFAEVVTLINSVDLTNDNAFASFYTTTNSRISSIETETGSYATTGSNNFNGYQTIDGGITASYYEGDGRVIDNLSAETNWNYNQEFTIKNTEQLTFSEDYVVENTYLLIEGSEETVEYSQNKSFKKYGTIFIGGNLLVKDSAIVNNGKISVGGEVILIGNSQITGTGTII